MTKRFIRLKELGSNINRNYIPSDLYLKKNNKLQKNEIYNTKTDIQGNQPSIWGSQSNKDIYLIGGSTIESIYVRSSMRPHSRLEKLLLKKGYNYSVFNLGVSGTQTQNIINLILNKLGNKQGSTLVVTLPTNDSNALGLEKNYFSDHWRYASIVPATNKKSTFIKNIDYEPYTRNIKIIIEICKLLELKLFFTTIVYAGFHEEYRILNDIAKSICVEKNIIIIDLQKKFSDKYDFFYDNLHFLPNGSQYYSEIIFNNIKNSLDTDGIKKINDYNICNNLFITEKISWSDYFNVSSLSGVKVIVDAELSLDSYSKQALLSVDYGTESVDTGLIKSSNDEIGYFKYLTAPAGKRIELVIDLEVPVNCMKMRVGLRAWNSKDIKIHYAFVSLINNTV